MKLLSLITEIAAELSKIENIRKYRFLVTLTATAGVIGAFLIRLVQGARSEAIVQYPLNFFNLLLRGLAPPLLLLLAAEPAFGSTTGEKQQVRSPSASKEPNITATMAALWLYTLKVLGLGLLTASLSVILLSGMTSISLLDLVIVYLLNALPLLGLTVVASFLVILLQNMFSRRREV